MLKWFRRIVLLTVVVFALPSAVVLGVGFYGMLFPPEAPLVLYMTRDEVVPDHPFQAPSEAMEALFNKFSGERSFAAFAADTKGHWAYTGGRHSPATARAQALARCGRDCVVMFEQRPKFWRDDVLGQTVSWNAAGSIILWLVRKPKFPSAYYALGDEGSWAVQSAEDGQFLPQWSVLNRCRAALKVSGTYWPEGLANPQCRIYHGTVALIGGDGKGLGGAAEPRV